MFTTEIENTLFEQHVNLYLYTRCLSW